MAKQITAREAWLEKLQKLIKTVKQWADELGWATREIEKKMEDPEIGDYQAPALLLQRETVRLLLEPIAREAPNTDGVVDLCLMPSYDDIASLYYYDDRWNVHYFHGENGLLDDKAKPLSKATLRKVFDQMMAHAG